MSISGFVRQVACGLFCVFAAGTGPAQAVSVTVELSGFGSDATAAVSARDAALSGAVAEVREGFEGIAAWGGRSGTANILNTAAGRFYGESRWNGSGGSAVDTGSGIEIRDETPMWGRQNLSAGGSNWLDSNDLEHVFWQAESTALPRFDSISFFLTDVGDIRHTDFRLSVGGAGIDTTVLHLPRQQNGSINLVRILFSEAVETASIRFTSQHNDGFGIDEASLALVSPVPLPGALTLMAAALAGLTAAGRRRRPA